MLKQTPWSPVLNVRRGTLRQLRRSSLGTLSSDRIGIQILASWDLKPSFFLAWTPLFISKCDWHLTFASCFECTVWNIFLCDKVFILTFSSEDVKVAVERKEIDVKNRGRQAFVWEHVLYLFFQRSSWADSWPSEVVGWNISVFHLTWLLLRYHRLPAGNLKKSSVEASLSVTSRHHPEPHWPRCSQNLMA